MLQFEFPALAAELGNGDTRSIIDDQIRFSDNSGSFNELRPVFIRQISGSECLGIHLGFQGEQTVYQLFFGHLKTEDRYGLPFLKSHILGYIQDESRFSHRRTGCNQNEIRWLKTGSFIIQIDKTGRNTCNGSFVF